MSADLATVRVTVTMPESIDKDRGLRGLRILAEHLHELEAASQVEEHGSPHYGGSYRSKRPLFYYRLVFDVERPKPASADGT